MIKRGVLREQTKSVNNIFVSFMRNLSIILLGLFFVSCSSDEAKNEPLTLQLIWQSYPLNEDVIKLQAIPDLNRAYILSQSREGRIRLIDLDGEESASALITPGALLNYVGTLHHKEASLPVLMRRHEDGFESYVIASGRASFVKVALDYDLEGGDFLTGPVTLCEARINSLSAKGTLPVLILAARVQNAYPVLATRLHVDDTTDGFKLNNSPGSSNPENLQNNAHICSYNANDGNRALIKTEKGWYAFDGKTRTLKAMDITRHRTSSDTKTKSVPFVLGEGISVKAPSELNILTAFSGFADPSFPDGFLAVWDEATQTIKFASLEPLNSME